MKLASVIYLSNQDVIGYPIEYVAANMARFVDGLWFLAGDEPSFQALAKVMDQTPRDIRGVLTRIDHPVRTVGDIPALMLEAFRFVRDLSDADFILISQADEVPTVEVMELIRGWMKPEHLQQARHCYCQIGFLYQYSATGWGNTICGRNFDGEFCADGLGYDGGGHYIGYLGDKVACYLEIGSLSPELYFRHQSQHVKTWREYGLMGPRLAAYPGAIEKDPALEPWLQTRIDRREFLRLSLEDGRKRIFGHPLVPVESVEPRFTKIIDELGLRTDCDEVCQLVKELGLDR